MIKSILVPTDGSKHADKALELAGDIASKYGAAVHVLNVYGHRDEAQLRHLAESEHLADVDISSPGGALVTMPISVYEDMRRAENRGAMGVVYEKIGGVITNHAETVLKEHGVSKVDHEITNGDPAEQIVEHAAKYKADMIIMGSRGLSDLKGLLMGSVSHKVSNSTPCTVVVVK